ncbi:MAG TPA: response regulator [Pirellulales bacterium]|nr:response regulator [Pirellulales bacterium]
MPTEHARILVVDDNPAGRYSTSHVLRGVGWQVLEAETGNEALAKVAEGVDLVALDVNLPDIDGFEVCRRIRENPKTARLPVIHLSATFVKDVDRVHGLESGADGYLVHPIEPPVLIATVRAFLRARRAEDDRERLLISERNAREEAERANQIKDDFLATLSHELRTPLHAIIGWAQLLKLGTLAPDDWAEAVDVIERNALAQAQMIADLLDISRITSGKLRIDIEVLDPVPVIEAAILAVLPAANAKGIRVSKSLDPSAGSVAGDPARLQQVVWNVVNNAVKFTPKGGKVDVTLRRIDSHIEIAVTDNGQGIDRTMLEGIFRRFIQEDSSTTRSHGGLGLGLAIAKQLIEMHGGRITAESDGPGRGARFVVILPLSPSGRPKQNPRESANIDAPRLAPIGSVRLDGVRVLLVDDENDARKVLAWVLTSAGAATCEADGVTPALSAIQSFKPDVLISDLGMPGRDGYELIRQIRVMGHTANRLPAIALTGFARPEDRHRALVAGFQIHVAKPVNGRELTTAIATLLGMTAGNPSDS